MCNNDHMLLLALFAFLAGIVTILSPCILPVLPIVLSGSLAGGHKRPIGVVIGFVGSFTFFTLALATLVKATGLPADALRNVAVAVILLFGISMLLPQTQVILEKLFSRLSSFTPQVSEQSGFWGGVIVGVSLGLVWSPCVGPILASVITLAITSQVSWAAVFITLAYAIGSGIPMLAIAYGGRALLHKIPGLLENTGKVQQVFGVLMIATAVAIALNIDRQFQTFLLTTFPQYGAGLTAIEQNNQVAKELEQLRNPPVQLIAQGSMAPDFTGGTGWINSPPLSLKKELKGKVVLVDFWTYSCINCIRTLPYLRKWYETYKDQGLVIVGVHSPEFEFEKVTENVKKAVADLQVPYPVVQDNNLAIWTAYNNQFWPAHYLIDQKGNIRYTHFGEGSYVETENAIRQLLNEKPISGQEVSLPSQQLTQETYLGWERADAYVNDNAIQPDKTVSYTFADDLPSDAVGLKGSWLVTKQFIQAQQDTVSLSLNFVANQVFLVMDKAPNVATSKVTVLLDGQPLPKKYWTKDMDESGKLILDGPRKYDVVDLHGAYGRHTIQLIFPTGAMAFAFTFG